VRGRELRALLLEILLADVVQGAPMNTGINALIALLPMGVMFIGLLKMLHRSNALMEQHVDLQRECEKASDRTKIAMTEAADAISHAFEVANDAELHACPVVPPAPRFETPTPGSDRFALLELV
jgi:hypothetical protein